MGLTPIRCAGFGKAIEAHTLRPRDAPAKCGGRVPRPETAHERCRKRPHGTAVAAESGRKENRKEPRMNRFIIPFVSAIPLMGLPLMVGCEREVATERKVDVKDDGTVVQKETKVTEDADGNLTKTDTKTVDKPAKVD
jgi:hypothetical protein